MPIIGMAKTAASPTPRAAPKANARAYVKALPGRQNKQKTAKVATTTTVKTMTAIAAENSGPMLPNA